MSGLEAPKKRVRMTEAQARNLEYTRQVKEEKLKSTLAQKEKAAAPEEYTKRARKPKPVVNKIADDSPDDPVTEHADDGVIWV